MTSRERINEHRKRYGNCGVFEKIQGPRVKSELEDSANGSRKLRGKSKKRKSTIVIFGTKKTIGRGDRRFVEMKEENSESDSQSTNQDMVGARSSYLSQVRGVGRRNNHVSMMDTFEADSNS